MEARAEGFAVDDVQGLEVRGGEGARGWEGGGGIASGE